MYMMNRLLHTLILLLLLMPAVSLHAQNDHRVDVELVAETTAFEPGETLWVALRMDHDPGWHSYWLNPGDAGQPTEIVWDELPGGVAVGDFVWPTPERFELPGDLVDYGFTGEVFHLMPVTVPADFTEPELTLNGTARWLECEEICIPASDDVSLTLPAAAAGSSPAESRWSEGFAATRADQPREDVSIDSMFSVVDGRIVLLVQATEPLFEDVDDVRFIPAQHRVFDYLDEPVIDHQVSSLQLSQAHHPRLTRENLPDRVKGLLLVTHEDGTEEQYAVNASPEQVDLSALGGEFPLFGDSGEAPGLMMVFLFAMTGGLILNLMPCVFPVLSLKVISLVEGSHSSPREQQLHGLVYTGGVILAFILLALALLLVQAGGQAVGWGFHLQAPWFVAGLIILFLFMGLSLSGWLTIGTRIMGVGSDLTLKDGYRGSFFTGVLASVVASPCTAPFMGAALGYALTQNAAVTLTVFAALGLGMALPFLLISFVPAFGRLLPKPGHWMVTFKQIMAIPLYLTVLWLLWVLSRQVSVAGLGLVVIMAALLAVLAITAQRAKRWQRPFRTATALTLLLTLGLLASPWLNTHVSDSQSGDGLSEPYSAARLAELREAGRPVFVNMTASWCITCLVNERVALSSEAVREALESHDVAYLKGDWTNNDPAITEVLKRYNTSGVPLYLMYPADDPEAPASVLPQILTENLVIEAIETAAGAES